MPHMRVGAPTVTPHLVQHFLSGFSEFSRICNNHSRRRTSSSTAYLSHVIPDRTSIDRQRRRSRCRRAQDTARIFRENNCAARAGNDEEVERDPQKMVQASRHDDERTMQPAQGAITRKPSNGYSCHRLSLTSCMHDSRDTAIQDTSIRHPPSASKKKQRLSCGPTYLEQSIATVAVSRRQSRHGHSPYPWTLVCEYLPAGRPGGLCRQRRHSILLYQIWAQSTVFYGNIRRINPIKCRIKRCRMHGNVSQSAKRIQSSKQAVHTPYPSQSDIPTRIHESIEDPSKRCSVLDYLRWYSRYY